MSQSQPDIGARAGATDTARLAQNLARNCGYAAFPCQADKKPRTPHGFEDAKTDPAEVADLWQRYPAPLIGIATGVRSGVSVLDIDRKHAPARAWWRANCGRLLPTRTYETQGGGLHLYYCHADGVTNTASKLCLGVDTRGEGGYVIFWFAVGLPCLAGLPCQDHGPPAAWPSWLLADLTRPKPKPARVTASVPAGAGADALGRFVREASEGERNRRLYWAALRCRDRRMSQAGTEALLRSPASQTGLQDFEISRTIRSAMQTEAA